MGHKLNYLHQVTHATHMLVVLVLHTVTCGSELTHLFLVVQSVYVEMVRA